MFQNAAREPLSQSLSHLFGQNQAPWLLLSQLLTGKGAGLDQSGSTQQILHGGGGDIQAQPGLCAWRRGCVLGTGVQWCLLHRRQRCPDKKSTDSPYYREQQILSPEQKMQQGQRKGEFLDIKKNLFLRKSECFIP